MTVGRDTPGGEISRPVGRRRRGRADWLTGARITAVHGLFYRPEGRAGEPEAVEFVLDGGASVLLTCVSDGTLGITAGAWPALPDWCVPAGQWEFGPLAQLPPPPYTGAWTVVGTREHRDSRERVNEAVFRCEEGDFVVLGGDTVTIRFISF
ncbi:hypothetical protein OG909_21105 [Streptomyces sp. NBC_01754]|uniref:hypothetical protein n=1 Tax=Streptomyces sp. NBC_01754 TaxID=2975930 RepID=UPI002DDA595D|nr:hypothetical protein [Streptomyces sp. NBC_01754]WSC94567.1 hypothetical protein OG909_21105 [Streptomyces sp. NBC_01754]